MLNNDHTRITIELPTLSAEEAANLVGVLEELIYQIVRQHSPRIDDYLAGPGELDAAPLDDDDLPF